MRGVGKYSLYLPTAFGVSLRLSFEKKKGKEKVIFNNQVYQYRLHEISSSCAYP